MQPYYAQQTGPVFIKTDWITGDTSIDATTSGAVFGTMGNNAIGETEAKSIHIFLPYGMYNKPIDSVGGSPTVKIVGIADNNENIGFACRDYPNIASFPYYIPGEQIIYAPKNLSQLYIKIDGSINLIPNIKDQTKGILVNQTNIQLNTKGGNVISLDDTNNILINSPAVNIGNNPTYPIMINPNALIQCLEAVSTALGSAMVPPSAAGAANPGNPDLTNAITTLNNTISALTVQITSTICKAL